MKQVDTDIAINKRHPEGVALIIYKNEEKTSATPIGWFMMCNSKPNCWAIALYKEHYSHQVISETKEFVLCLPSFAQEKDIQYLGSVHGWKVDKLKNCKLETIPSKKISPPIIKDSIACFECKVTKTCDAGDHTIFIGEILVSYISDRKDKMYNFGSKNLIEWELKND